MNRILTWLLIASVAVIFSITAGPVSAAFAAFTLAALCSPFRPTVFGANSIDAELNLNEILDSALTAFKRAIINLQVFATVFRNVQLRGTNKVLVPYYPLETSASRDFDREDGYVFDDASSTASREVTVNKRKYQPLLLTSEEIARYPLLNATRLGAQKGEKLAYDVIMDILSMITAANYPQDHPLGAASAFDSDDVIDIRGEANEIPWPLTSRGLLVNTDYDTALMKDSDVKLEYARGSDSVIVDGILPRLAGFDYGFSPAIPANGESLVGMALHQSALLVAFSPIEPAPAVRDQMVDYQIVTDEATGITLEYRVWGDPDMDAEKRVIECNYGYAKGVAEALIRLTSTEP